jgi:hypothetical protein
MHSYLLVIPFQFCSKHLFRTNSQALATLSASVEEIMVKVRSHLQFLLLSNSGLQLAEIDIRLRTPDPADGAKWSP